ncbi:Coiled-coil protein [Giardia lamblia P15]|uniref:Coiled-coil protein n=1 Tax=Giardia intestinalis (strain P15) TaxID=658858 RepID=E1F4C7_GIAIA|nr:Coiled-coil protein [Giardia lamblia P15]
MSVMKDVNLREVLTTIWRPIELAMPAFANEENMQRHEDLKEVSTEITTLIDELSQLESRTLAMKKHSEAVVQELNHAQSLANARDQEVRAEKHLTTLVERDLGRMNAKIRQCEGMKNTVEERRQVGQTNLLKQHTRLAELQKDAQWLEDERAEWHLASEQKSDDAFTLQKYTAIDEKRRGDLEQALRRQHEVITSLTDLLKTEVNETMTAQVSLDKAAITFSRLQESRRVAMGQFQQAVVLLESKDTQEAMLNERYESSRLDLENLRATDRRAQQELEEVIRARNVANSELESMERETNTASAALVVAEKELDAMNGEILIQRSALSSAQRDISAKQATLESMQQSYENRVKDSQRLDARLELLAAVKEEMKAKALTLEETTAYMTKMVDAVEKEYEFKRKESQDTTKRLQEIGQKLAEFKRQEANEKNDISGLQSSIKGLESRIQEFEKQIQQQRKHIYNADYEIQALTRKLSIVRGDHSLEELIVLKRNIASLTQQLETELRTAKLVKQQTGSVRSEVERLNRTLTDLKQKRDKLDSDLHENLLSSNTAADALKKLNNQKADMLLQLDSMKIKRDELLEKYKNRTTILFGLTNRKEQIRIGNVKRSKELETVKSLLAQEIRLLTQDLSAVRLELKKRRIYIEKLKIRCDILTDRVGSLTCAASGKPMDEADPRTAQSDAIINFGKKNADLQARYEEYSAKLKQAEVEVAGLQQALELLRASNAQIRKSVRPATPGSALTEEKKQVESEIEQTNSEIAYLNTNIRKIVNEISSLTRRNEELQAQIDELAVTLHDVEYGE